MKTDNQDGAIEPVFLTPVHHRDEWSAQLLRTVMTAANFNGNVIEALPWIIEVAAWAPQPAEGHTVQLWELLASVGASDVSVARVLEPHLDALAILKQAPDRVALESVGVDSTSTWGVYAAEGPDMRLVASQSGSTWLLDGVKPWCSLAHNLSHALVTAHTGDCSRRLFAVNLREASVHAESGPWVSRGMQHVISAPVRFTQAQAVPVGPDQWYLQRPGFEWGGMGVAACWWGGAVGTARTLYDWALQREPDQIALMHLGAIDTALNAARTVLAEAATSIDDNEFPGVPVAITARRLRNFVAKTVDSTLKHLAHALGPAPLVMNETHARRVADLQIYVRQHHAEHDEASLGRRLIQQEARPW